MSEHRMVAGGGASMPPTTSRTGPFRHLQRLSTWLASETTQHGFATIVYVGGLGLVGGVLYPVFSLPDYVPNPDLAGWRLLLAGPAIVALVSFPWWPSLTKTSGRILGGAALVLTTAAFTNGFMDRLQASQLDESDRWYVASQIERFHATDFLLYTLAGAAFVLAAELKSDPVRDDQLLPPSRPRWVAWILSFFALGLVGLIAIAIPESLDEATGQRIPLAGFMAGAAVLGMIGLLSPVPVLRHLGQRLVGFAAIVAATAWGVLWGLLYAQRIPVRVGTDLGGQAELEFRPDQPKSLLEPIRDAKALYQSFFLVLLFGVILSGLHYAMRRVRHAR